ncbi:MAG: spore germination protein [Bacilli bacterium]
MIIKNKRLEIISEFKKKTGDATDITYKDIPINNEIITAIYSNSVSSSISINDFILRRLDEEKSKIKTKDLFLYIKNYIPNNNGKEITEEEISYYVLSGFTIILFENNKGILAFENKADLYSEINKSEKEKSLKGPTDAFSENYQSNIGMIRRRIKSENLWFKEARVGKKSQTMVAIFYLNKTCDEKLVNDIYKKIKNIDIEYAGNTNYVLEAISNSQRNVFPTNLYTERPDYACQMIMEGRIILMVENSNEVAILPTLFLDFFKSPSDYYEKSINVTANRFVRFIAFILAILTPAMYIALMAFNWESLPSDLLISFSIQRDGVPFSTVFEIVTMIFMFQILRESDIRFPGKGGSSISIVGALVLGQAAVDAGIVSPITIIIVGICSIASLAFSSIELVNSIRWWQLFLIILAALFGFIGIVFGILILLAILVSEQSCGKPYFSPFEPFNLNGQSDAIILNTKSKLHPKNIFIRRK